MAEKTVDQELNEKEQKQLEKRQAAVEAYKAAQDLVRSSYDEIKDALDNDELFQAIVKVVGNKRGTGTGTKRIPGAKRTSMNDQIAAKFLAVGIGGSVSDFDLFKEFKVGAERMRWFIIAMIKDAKPEERMWVRYNSETEAYEYVAQGADVPEGWDGYLPKDESLL